MPRVSLRHRGYLYAQSKYHAARSSRRHPIVERMRLAEAWRAGYIAGAREQSSADFAAVKRLGDTVRAAEHILDDDSFDWNALAELRKL